MSDKPIIMAGLAVFMVLVTFPIWYAFVPGEEVAPPDRQSPKDGSRCVEGSVWMVENHMTLLNQWRYEVIREGDRTPYESEAFGTLHKKSLTRTCMTCHSKKEMCDSNGNTSCARCHDYVNVKPNCWDCHVELKGD